MSRVPLTMACIRLLGTPIARARRFWLMPISFRNSSLSILPGWGLRSCVMSASFASLEPSMVVDDFDLMGVMLDPAETQAPLVVDADAHLPGACAAERLEPIAGRVPQVLDRV